MKKIGYLIIIAVCSMGLISCDEEEDNPVVTTTTTTIATTVATNATIAGVGSLPPGVNGSIQNTRVALYTSVDDWNQDRTFKFAACDGNGNYSMTGVVPGVFYVDAWKDNDNNGFWGSPGDYVWINGSGVYPNYTLAPIQFPVGTTVVNFQVFVVP